MSEEIPVGGRRIYRRKRRFQGATWTPPSLSADVEDGLWCRRCSKRHGYMTMHMGYEKDPTTSKWKVLWMCPVDERVLNP